jgi:hypothetical protein
MRARRFDERPSHPFIRISVFLSVFERRYPQGGPLGLAHLPAFVLSFRDAAFAFALNIHQAFTTANTRLLFSVSRCAAAHILE